MAIACVECGHEIRPGTSIITHDPPLFLVRLGIDLERTYHHACYINAEAAAADDLRHLTAPQEAPP